MSGTSESENIGKSSTYMGFDFSTQQVKSVVMNDDGNICHEASVMFDSELPEYRTHGGVNVHDDGRTVTAPTVMWIKALDMLMDKLRVSGADFSLVAGLSGAAQQHGSVYWKKGSSETLSNLDPVKFLHHQLCSCFSLNDSPVWMDSSTTAYCRNLERCLGGADILAEITGSRGYERFTGNQIAKVASEKKGVLANTEAIYPDLKELLGDPVLSNSITGSVSDYFIQRYDMNPDCKVVQFTGDNQSSFAGMMLREGDVAISLGTSDTLFLWLPEPRPCQNGHVFINPLSVESYMGLICFKNGSCARERVRDEYADGSWDIFSQLLDMTPRGNFGNIGMFYYNPEITPEIDGVFRFNKAGEPVSRFASNEVEVRSLVEGQLVAKRIYAQKLGLNLKDIKRILATGGASQNKSILQVLSDVFNAPVFTANSTVNSACLGAALRAQYTVLSTEKPFWEVVKEPKYSRTCIPNQDAKDVYDALTARYEELENSVLLASSSSCE